VAEYERGWTDGRRAKVGKYKFRTFSLSPASSFRGASIATVTDGKTGKSSIGQGRTKAEAEEQAIKKLLDKP
jgi:hypothetical protein